MSYEVPGTVVVVSSLTVVKITSECRQEAQSDHLQVDHCQRSSTSFGVFPF